MRVALRYGTGTVELELPDEACAGVHRMPRPGAASGAGPTAGPGGAGARGGGDAAGEADPLARALAELDAAGLAERVRGRRVALLLPDGTRATPLDRLLAPLAERLAGARSVEAFLCTGTHDPALPETRRLAARVATGLAGLAERLTVTVHDAAGAVLDRGRTARGTPVLVHPRTEAAELFLALSDMKPHYFAGYSNPAKSIAPGLCARETARANHALALRPDARWGHHPWHPDPARRANPLAADLVEAWERVLEGRPALALCTLGGGGPLVWAGAGEAALAAGRGMREVDRRLAVAVEPTRYLVLSGGGAPYDESLYTVQRALELAREALLPGGEVLLLAACPHGVGSESARRLFADRLARPLDEVLAPREAPLELYGHKAVKLADWLRRIGPVHLASGMPAAEVERLHLRPCPDPQGLVDRWVADARARAGAGTRERVRFVDDGSSLALAASRA